MNFMGMKGDVGAFFEVVDVWCRAEDAEMLLAAILGRERRGSPLGAAWQPSVIRCLGAMGGLCGGGLDGSLFT